MNEHGVQLSSSWLRAVIAVKKAFDGRDSQPSVLARHPTPCGCIRVAFQPLSPNVLHTKCGWHSICLWATPTVTLRFSVRPRCHDIRQQLMHRRRAEVRGAAATDPRHLGHQTAGRELFVMDKARQNVSSSSMRAIDIGRGDSCFRSSVFRIRRGFAVYITYRSGTEITAMAWQVQWAVH